MRWVSFVTLLLCSVATDASTPAVPAVIEFEASTFVSGAVSRFYDAHGGAPLWFRSAGESPAAKQLLTIIRGAELDGLASAPQLAAQAEAAILAAQSGAPADIAQADQLLSAIWVRYVQSLSAPVKGMIYGYQQPTPHPARILQQATDAPFLPQHLVTVSRINPLYAELRDAASSQLQSNGGTPDRRLIANLERARIIPSTGRFILVDAAAARLWMYQDGQVQDSMKVIVGKADHPTPMIASVIYYATFNPYWNAPAELVRKNIAPKVLRQGTAYLRARGYQVISGWSDDAPIVAPDDVDWKAVAEGRTQIRVRQSPSAANAMGKLKFPFPNGEDIYLHDTPDKALFAKEQRTLSNGCIRLEDAARLGRWLFGREPIAPSTLPEQHVQLPQGVPIYVTYLTARPEAGKVTFLEDVYGRDTISAPVLSAR